MPYTDLTRGRHSLPNQVYAVTTVTRERSPIFSDFFSARVLAAELRQQHDDRIVQSLAWMIMPDHLHWLFQLTGTVTLPGVIKRMKGRTSRILGMRLDLNGGIWQRAYYDRAIRTEEDLRQVARYIIANPLRAGLVTDIGDYPHWDCLWL